VNDFRLVDAYLWEGGQTPTFVLQHKIILPTADYRFCRQIMEVDQEPEFSDDCELS
jgi:hypothetical protein